MVQYIHTPWRDRHELLMVRKQFYPRQSHSGTAATEPNASVDEVSEWDVQKQKAVARASMWMQRGNCPHMVESTALLTAAILSDEKAAREGDGASAYAVRATYSAAFSRFVTGLLDGHQDKQRKMSMYLVAKNIGLPATFVELRHQATHEQLPSLPKLRSGARKALIWIWDYYWKHLSEDEDSTKDSGQADSCRAWLQDYLKQDNAAKKRSMKKQIRQWDESRLLETLGKIGDETQDSKLILRSLQLSREIFQDGKEAIGTDGIKDFEMIRAELLESDQALDAQEGQYADHQMKDSSEELLSKGGWSIFDGTWTPKPIGIV